MIEIREDRPPYVRFEKRAVEDKIESVNKGHYVAKDVDFVLITPSGSKDLVERKAVDWLKHIESESLNGRFPAMWVEAYKSAYRQWLEGQEAPLEGTPLANWPGLSPAQYHTLIEFHIRTVEDLAQATEEALANIGMGARALKQRAQAYLSSSSDMGKVAEELAAIRDEVAKLKERNTTLEQANAELKKLVDTQPKK